MPSVFKMVNAQPPRITRPEHSRTILNSGTCIRKVCCRVKTAKMGSCAASVREGQWTSRPDSAVDIYD